ncbi:capsid triplex subunit 1 [Equid alphaherpesvirus 8]|uniref:Capsid triplex subunit 1 n=1 Tax=Equid alphaherpesvirus 8 TaxID=39637 RepID=I1V8D5_9ALPH|nr:ORF22 gene product [Equid alphaherpesvirus 8]AFI33157.1 capsid triplex subunit 1 [Equid alphaherpesvirus 8]
MNLGGNRFVQIGNGMSNIMYTDANGTVRWEQIPPPTGFPQQPRGRGRGHVSFGLPNTLDWLPGFVQATPNSITISNMGGIQISSAGVITAAINSEQNSWMLSSSNPSLKLTRQVTLTDFCDPTAERPGLMIIRLRNHLDAIGSSPSSTPPGRNPQDLDEAWAALAELSVSGRSDTTGLRPSLLSLTFLVASRSGEYADKAAAEAVRAHVLANYRDRRTEQRLDRFGEYLQAMVRTHVFPHKHMTVVGGLLSHVIQDKLASLTAVAGGVQEGARTNNSAIPRSSVYVPACAFLDMDHELKLGDASAKFVYLIFVYNQRLHREGVRVYVAVSKFNEVAFEDAVSFLFHKARTESAIRGTEGANAPEPHPNAALPLQELASSRCEPRCPPSRLNNREFTNALYQWAPDLRGRPNKTSCMYAAYMRLGAIASDSPRTTRRSERFGSVDMPVVWLENVRWDPQDWVECSY